MPTLFVVIPVYNAADYLADTVASVFAQGLSSVRVILVDDGSTDGSAQLCELLEKSDRRITAIHHENHENRGVSYTRNRGIDAALSEADDSDWLCFLDSDDLWVKSTLSDALLDRPQEIELFGFGTAYVSHDLASLRWEEKNPDAVYEGGEREGQLRGPFAAVLYRASLLRRTGLRFREELRHNEDLIFKAECRFLCKKIETSQKTLYLYRNNPTSATHRRRAGYALYLPLIDSWLASEERMKPHENDKRGCYRAARGTALYCMIEMAEDHYFSLEGGKSATAVLRAHPLWDELDALDEVTCPEGFYPRLTLLRRHPHLFACYHRLRGVAYRLLKPLTSIPPFKALLDRRRYAAPNPYLTPQKNAAKENTV